MASIIKWYKICLCLCWQAQYIFLHQSTLELLNTKGNSQSIWFVSYSALEKMDSLEAMEGKQDLKKTHLKKHTYHRTVLTHKHVYTGLQVMLNWNGRRPLCEGKLTLAMSTYCHFSGVIRMRSVHPGLHLPKRRWTIMWTAVCQSNKAPLLSTVLSLLNPLNLLCTCFWRLRETKGRQEFQKEHGWKANSDLTVTALSQVYRYFAQSDFTVHCNDCIMLISSVFFVR